MATTDETAQTVRRKTPQATRFFFKPIRSEWALGYLFVAPSEGSPDRFVRSALRQTTPDIRFRLMQTEN